MKKQFLKIAGVKTEQEFYDKYPSEEAFFEAHPNALKQLAGGGEAYPQTATMDNFFSYGVPVPPTYYAHGGAFPMAQSEEQFFSPFYGNVPNPYNKAMGGSSESYRQAMSFPYGNTGRSTHFMMQDGGYMADEPELPKMGVNGKLLEFVGTVKNTAANKLNSNLKMYGKVKNPEQYEFEKAYGGTIKQYQSQTTAAVPEFDLSKATVSPAPPMDPKKAYEFYTQSSPAANQFSDASVVYNDANSDRGTVTNNYYYGPGTQQPGNQQLPPEYYNDIDYLQRGRMRPRSDFDIKGKGMFGKYRSTGWLKDEYGVDRLHQMGMTHMEEKNPRWFQLLKRPTKTYYFGDQGNSGGTNQQDMGNNANQTNFQNTPTPQNNQQPAPPNQGDQSQDKKKGFFGKLFNKENNPNNITPQPGTMTNVVPNQQVQGPDMVSQRTNQMWNRDFTPKRNQRIQNRLGRIDAKLDKLQAFDAWQDKQTGEAGDLSGRMGRQQKRLERRRDRLENRMTRKEFGGELDDYQSKKTTGTVKTPKGQELPLNDHRFNERTTFKPSMTVEEYLRSQQVNAQPVPVPALIPFVASPSLSNNKASFYDPGLDMFGGIEYIMPDSINFDSTNTDHRAAMMKAILNGATDDTYDELLPSMKNKKHGGSYNAGDVVDMTPEELQRFIAMGGQVEFLD